PRPPLAPLPLHAALPISLRLPPAQRGPARALAERAGGGSLHPADGHARGRYRGAARQCIRSAAAVPTPLGPGVTPPLPGAPGQGGQRSSVKSPPADLAALGASQYISVVQFVQLIFAAVMTWRPSAASGPSLPRRRKSCA